MDVKTIAVAILGGAFDSNELGDNDIACVPGALEDLQLRHVTGCDDVQLELVERSHVERLTAERDALQQLLNARDEEMDRLRNQLAQCEAMAMMVAEREWAEHVGTGPVSSKVEAAFTQLHSELQEAQGKLAERDALLREIRRKPGLFSGDFVLRLDQVLSASAEPSAPTPMPAYMEAACDKFDWTPEQALRFYAEGKHFDTDNGRTRILCTGAIASHALKGMSKEYADLKGSEQAEPSASVEIDERAGITLEQVLRAYEYAERHPHRYLRGTTNWCAAVAHSLNKQSRATLGRKP